MYNYLKGLVIEIESPYVTIEVSGVGWHVYASEPLMASLKVGEHVTVFVYLDIKEASQVLYGFATVMERELFKILLGVNGVGAKSAIALLSLGVNTLTSAVSSGNSLVLAKVKGVSQKLGEKVVLELRSKILKKFNVAGNGHFENEVKTERQSLYATAEVQDAIFGLMSLGMTRVRVQEIIERMDVAGKTAEEIIVEVLSKR